MVSCSQEGGALPRCCGSSPAGALPLHPSQAPPDTRPRRERLRRGLGAIAPAVCGRLPPKPSGVDHRLAHTARAWTSSDGQLLPGGRRAAAPQGQPGGIGSRCCTLLNGFILIFLFLVHGQELPWHPSGPAGSGSQKGIISLSGPKTVSASKTQEASVSCKITNSGTPSISSALNKEPTVILL